MRIKAGYRLNEIGGRQNNEDSIFPPITSEIDGKVFIVCDGVGGSNCGEIASSITANSMGEYFNAFAFDNATLDIGFVKRAQSVALKNFSDYIRDHPGARNMSTTLTLACLRGNSIFVAWCGDSKIMHVRNGEVIWESQDHSLVNALVQKGEITQEEAAIHPQKNVILRSISSDVSTSEIETHVIEDVINGDFLLLCTDGLLENINSAVLRAELKGNSPQDLAERFNQHCHGKTRDNYSMYLLELEETITSKIPALGAPRRVKKSYTLLTSSILTILVVGAFFWKFYLTPEVPEHAEPSFEQELELHSPANTELPPSNVQPVKEKIDSDQPSKTEQPLETSLAPIPPSDQDSKINDKKETQPQLTPAKDTKPEGTVNSDQKNKTTQPATPAKKISNGQNKTAIENVNEEKSEDTPDKKTIDDASKKIHLENTPEKPDKAPRPKPNNPLEDKKSNPKEDVEKNDGKDERYNSKSN
jgi:protein phosphatase